MIFFLYFINKNSHNRSVAHRWAAHNSVSLLNESVFLNKSGESVIQRPIREDFHLLWFLFGVLRHLISGWKKSFYFTFFTLTQKASSCKTVILYNPFLKSNLPSHETAAEQQLTNQSIISHSRSPFCPPVFCYWMNELHWTNPLN